MIIKGRKTKREINEWLLTFQKGVDKLAECNCLQFTAKVLDTEYDTSV